MFDNNVPPEMIDRIRSLVEQGIFKSMSATHNIGILELPPFMITLEIEVNDIAGTAISTPDPKILDVFITYYEQFKK